MTKWNAPQAKQVAFFVVLLLQLTTPDHWIYCMHACPTVERKLNFWLFGFLAFWFACESTVDDCSWSNKVHNYILLASSYRSPLHKEWALCLNSEGGCLSFKYWTRNYYFRTLSLENWPDGPELSLFTRIALLITRMAPPTLAVDGKCRN